MEMSSFLEIIMVMGRSHEDEEEVGVKMSYLFLLVLPLSVPLEALRVLHIFTVDVTPIRIYFGAAITRRNADDIWVRHFPFMLYRHTYSHFHKKKLKMSFE
jgi:hypothetical protein